MEIKAKELYFSVKLTIPIETFFQSCVRLNILEETDALKPTANEKNQSLSSYAD